MIHMQFVRIRDNALVMDGCCPSEDHMNDFLYEKVSELGLGDWLVNRLKQCLCFESRAMFLERCGLKVLYETLEQKEDS